MKRVVFVALVVFLAVANPGLVVASQEHEAVSGTTSGHGLESLKIDGEPDEHGLIWMLNEPERDHETWYAWVLNTNDHPVFNIEATLEVLSNDIWHLPNTDSSGRFVRPTQIDPGGIGIVDFGNIGSFSNPWVDLRVVVDSIYLEPGSTLVHITTPTVAGFSGMNGSYTVTITNNTGFVLTELNVIVGCVQNGEIVMIDRDQSDLIQLKPGDSETWSFESKAKCSAADQIVTASARVVD